MSIEFDFSEVDRLAGDIAEAGPKAEKVSSTQLSKVAKHTQSAAKSHAPVDTGTLRDSITIRGGKDYRIVGSELRYAGFVEFGTSDTAPQPYIWPAARVAETELFEALRDIEPFT